MSPNDLQLALVENHAQEDSMGAESCVRYYEIGRSKADDLVTGLDVRDTYIDYCDNIIFQNEIINM